MTEDFPTLLVELVKKRTLELDYAKGYLFRQVNKGKMDNLDYIECLNALRKYEKSVNRAGEISR